MNDFSIPTVIRVNLGDYWEERHYDPTGRLIKKQHIPKTLKGAEIRKKTRGKNKRRRRQSIFFK